MTLRIPEPNLIDRILAIFGKERRLVPPRGYDKLGPYVSAELRRECFLKTLFRRKSTNDPKGLDL